MRTIAGVLGRSVATISRVLATLGLSSLKALTPKPPVMRYERSVPGEMRHLGTKKLGRIVRPSHRVTGDRRDSVDGVGWDDACILGGSSRIITIPTQIGCCFCSQIRGIKAKWRYRA